MLLYIAIHNMWYLHMIIIVIQDIPTNGFDINMLCQCLQQKYVMKVNCHMWEE